MIVFVMRHADRKPDPADELSAVGRERATLLARMLGESGVSIAYCSDANRARETLAPLKQKLEGALAIKEIEIAGANGVDEHVHKIVTDIKSLAAEKIVAVVSHSNTVGRIIAGLEGGIVGSIGADEFDKLFVLFIQPAVGVHVLRMRYGAAT